MTAEHLHAQIGGLTAQLGQESLQDWRQEAEFVVIFLNLGGIACGMRFHHMVRDLGGVIEHGAAAFRDGFLGQQHTPDIGMVNQAVCNFIRLFLAGQRPHGTALPGVIQSPLIGQLGGANPLNCRTDAGCVHKGEHALQALILRADQIAGGAIEIHHTGGRSLDAHFLLQRAATDGVALTDTALGIGQELGHDKQADAFGAFRGIRQTGQHDVNDVFGQIVLA